MSLHNRGPQHGKKRIRETYAEQIDALIPDAERLANLNHGVHHGTRLRSEWARDWDRKFHDVMDKAAKEAGLRMMSYQRRDMH